MMSSDDVLRGSIALVAGLFLLAVGFEIFREAADHQRTREAMSNTPNHPSLPTNSAPLARSWLNRTGPGAYSGPQTGPPVSTNALFQ